LVKGSPPPLTLDTEIRVQSVCLEGIRKGIIRSAHDVSDGGLAVCLAESLLDSQPGLGTEIHLSRRLRNDELLFGESQSVIVVTVIEDDLLPLQRIAMEEQVPSITIGRVTDMGRLQINDLIDLPRKELREAYMESFARIMGV
jgi:phosphoribosylformylglycinamidine synthase